MSQNVKNINPKFLPYDAVIFLPVAIVVNIHNNKETSCTKLVISVKEHLVEVVDKLSTTVVVFFRSERILKCKCLYGA